MIEQGTAGRIITLSSDAGVLVNPHGSQAMYATAKAAVNHFSKALGQQLRHHNINVNVISPGSIASGRIVRNAAKRIGNVTIRAALAKEIRAPENVTFQRAAHGQRSGS